MNNSSGSNPQMNISGSSVEGQVVQAGGDVTQIQLKNVTFNKTQIIQISVAEIKTRPFKLESPYQGLDFFDRDDQDYLFGRDQFLTGLVNELEQSNLILLLGASGSGKSSVVRAGLIPWLVKQRGTKLKTFVFTPNQDPFESFYASLLIQNYQQLDAQIVRSGEAEALVRSVQTLKRPESDWFIFIDQFEELFPGAQSDRQKLFMAGLVQLSQARLPGVKIMMAMRADFLDRLSPYSVFIQLTNSHRPMLAEMRRDELRLAIEQPAAHHGVVFEEGLVEEIIKDVQGQAGYLPLLQYALDLLWKTEEKSDRALKISTYRRLGGIRGSLQQRIDQLYSTLSLPQQSATQRIFLRLVGIGGDEGSETDWKPIRRRADRAEFSDPLEQSVLTQLIDEKLLVSDRQPHTQQSTIELAHEILLSSWTMLNQWIRENRQAIALRNRLNDDVGRWQANQQADELWSGSKLEQVVELRKDTTFNQVLGGFSGAANQFIEKSVEKRDRLRQRQVRAAIAISALIASIIAGSAVIFAIQQQQNQEKIEAVFLDTDTQEIIAQLPGVLQQAQAYQATVDRLKETDDLDRAIAYYQEHKSELDKAFAYYRQILRATGRLQQRIQKNSHEFAKTLKPGETPQVVSQKLNQISQTAETALADLILKYRIPELKKFLLHRPPILGELSPDQEITAFEDRYTPGALRATYELLMRSSGAGADLNNDGLIRDDQEAAQIPCTLLKQVEQLWHQATANRCGWYGSESVYLSDACQPILGKVSNFSTLTTAIFSTTAEPMTHRFEQCGIYAPKPSSPNRASIKPTQKSR